MGPRAGALDRQPQAREPGALVTQPASQRRSNARGEGREGSATLGDPGLWPKPGKARLDLGEGPLTTAHATLVGAAHLLAELREPQPT